VTATRTSQGGISPAAIEAECRTLCLCMIGVEPTAYVVAQYRRAHEVGSVSPDEAADDAWRADAVLLPLARTSPALARLADTWAILFAKGCLLRRKLVLLLAILECSSPTDRMVDSAVPGPVIGFFAGMAWSGAAFAMRAIVATVIVVPLLAIGAMGGRRTIGPVASGHAPASTVSGGRSPRPAGGER